MTPKKAIEELWKLGFFEKHRKSGEAGYEVFNEYGCTYSNWEVLLKRSNFLRKEKKGWIQKQRHPKYVKQKQSTLDYFKLFKIHPEIKKTSSKLFEDGYYAEAIFNAFKKLNNLVKKKSNKTSLDGKNLMLTVFSKDNPVLKFNDLKTISDKDEQEGFMHLFAGAVQGIRNPKGHEDIIQKDKIRAREYLIFASLLAKRLDESKKS